MFTKRFFSKSLILYDSPKREESGSIYLDVGGAHMISLRISTLQPTEALVDVIIDPFVGHAWFQLVVADWAEDGRTCITDIMCE